MFPVYGTVLFVFYALLAIKNIRSVNALGKEFSDDDPLQNEAIKFSIRGLFQRTLWLTIFFVLVLVMLYCLG